MPSPEQGASTSTQSNTRRNGSGRARVRLHDRGRACAPDARDGLRQQLEPLGRGRPPPRPSPVAAHRRRHLRRLAAGRRARVEDRVRRARPPPNAPTSCDASSWTTNSPSCASGVEQGIAADRRSARRARIAPARVRDAGLGQARRQGRRAWSAGVFARSVSAAGSLSNRPTPRPRRTRSGPAIARTSQRGCDSVIARVVDSARDRRARPAAAAFALARHASRSTALTNAAALRLPALPARSTASFTAADAGTRSRWSSWKMLSRRMASDLGVQLRRAAAPRTSR